MAARRLLVLIMWIRAAVGFVVEHSSSRTGLSQRRRVVGGGTQDENFGSALQGKAARIGRRRQLLYEDHERRKNGEVYKGDGLLLDNRLEDPASSTEALLERLEEVCRIAVELSTGNGTESSGEGRYSWGTWVDTDKYNAVRDASADVRLTAGKGFWIELNGTTILKAGDLWSVTLRVLEPGASVRSQFRPGSHVLFQPLFGTASVQKLRRRGPDDFVDLGKPRKLQGASKMSSEVGDPFRLLGGPPHRLSAKGGEAAVLEVVLRPPTGEAEEDTDDKKTIPPEFLISNQLWDASSEDAALFKAKDDELKRKQNLAAATKGSLATNVGGLEKQLDALVRRVLASRSDPRAAKLLGIDHVRGVLLSGPPGCGKTLLARELARELGAREPQIVNGPEILDKFVGEAERKVRKLFEPAEIEYNQVGDNAALHVIILDEMDAIARKRGSLSGDTTGVRDGVVNTLLAKMDGVATAPNILVVGLTNRPELIDPALKRPGRLEVNIAIERPDKAGRRQILRIHTRAMRANGALSSDAAAFVDDEEGLATMTDDFSGAELAGLVRSAASFALGRAADSSDDDVAVTRLDLENALTELRAAASTDADALKSRFSQYGVNSVAAHDPVKAELRRFLHAVPQRRSPRSLLLRNEVNGAGASSLAAWAAVEAKDADVVDFVDFVDAADPRFLEADSWHQIWNDATRDRDGMSLVILDDVDFQDKVFKALLRRPLPSGANLVVIATSGTDHGGGLFDEVIDVPAVSDVNDAASLLRSVLPSGVDYDLLANNVLHQSSLGCKTILNVAERARSALEIQAKTDDPSRSSRSLTDLLSHYTESSISSSSR